MGALQIWDDMLHNAVFIMVQMYCIYIMMMQIKLFYCFTV